MSILLKCKVSDVKYLLLLLVILVMGCDFSSERHEDTPDYDRLYLSPSSHEYRDSLTLALRPEVSKALKLSNTSHNKLVIDSLLSELRWSSDSTSLNALSTLALQFAEQDNDKYFKSKVYTYLATYHHNYHVLDSTYYYYIKAENEYIELQDTLKIGENGFYQARLLYEIGLSMESEVKVSNSLLLLERDPSNPIHFEANQLLAICLFDRDNYIESQRYFEKAIALMKADLGEYEILSKERLHLALSVGLGNLSNINLLSGNYKAAVSYGREGLEYIGEDGHPSWVAFLKTLVANADYHLTKNPINLEIVKENFKVDSLLKHPYHMAMTALELADMYALDAEYNEEALKWARKAYIITKESNLPRDQFDALEFILTHSLVKNSDDVEELIALNRQLKREDSITRNKFARIAYETAVVEAENKKLREKLLLILVISIVVVLFLIIISYIFRLRSKEKEIKLMKFQRNADEQINNLMVEKGLIASEVKSQERDRMAKALHDGIINSVFGIRFNLQQLHCSDLELKGLLVKELEKVEISTRAISHDLQSNAAFSDSEFKHILEEFVLFQKNEFNTEFQLVISECVDLETLTVAEKMNIYFIIKEAIQNVNKHSHATLCTIKFSCGDNVIIVSIEDNGDGFEQGRSKGIGLNNMTDRAKKLGTMLVVESSKSGGTCISFTIEV